MIKVCDAIMGSGKSSAAITYINENPDRKFIYISPYIDEDKRIVENCANMEFYEPEKVFRYKGSKVLYTKELVKRGLNIATTHQAFKFYDNELIDLIQDRHYTLIIDEDLDLLERLGTDPYDVKMAIDAGYIREVRPSVYRLSENKYKGKTHSELFRVAESREIILVSSKERSFAFYWQLPAELLYAFDDVFILTYLFEGQGLHCALEMYDMSYENTGIELDDKGVYRFSETGHYVPPYVRDLKKKIHIVRDKKLNAIGDDQWALSEAWFNKPDSDVTQLKKHIHNFFKRKARTDYNKRMWSTYKSAESKIKGDGYARQFIPFNARARNDLRNREALAYCINVFMNVGKRIYYKQNGADIDDDTYALSVMIQWIWRSAIRDGQDIRVYIPSKRMRDLLEDWMETIEETG